MRYEGSVYRPPSEARSLIIQVTIGCSHNQCTFCSMYKDKKFRIRPMEEIEEDLKMARTYYKEVKRIFLADGDALVLKTEDLKKILYRIKEWFPECERVGIYAAPKDILRKSVQELEDLNKLGLGIAYLGIETGSDEILKDIHKGVTAEEIITAGRKVVQSGIELSVTLISGLGTAKKWMEHATESARVINEINPHYVGLLTLLVQEGTPMYDQVKIGEIQLMTPKEVMMETMVLIKDLDLEHCVFRSNHASNYIPLMGTLPEDKEKLLAQLDQMIHGEYDFKDEFFRRL